MCPAQGTSPCKHCTWLPVKCLPCPSCGTGLHVHVVGFSQRCSWGVRSSGSRGPIRLLVLEGEGTVPSKRLEPLTRDTRSYCSRQSCVLCRRDSCRAAQLAAPPVRFGVVTLIVTSEMEFSHFSYADFERNLVTGTFCGGGECETWIAGGFWKVILPPTPTACYACVPPTCQCGWKRPDRQATPTQPRASPRTPAASLGQSYDEVGSDVATLCVGVRWWRHCVLVDTEKWEREETAFVIIITGGGQKSTVLKIPRQNPLVLLVKVAWRAEDCCGCAGEGRSGAFRLNVDTVGRAAWEACGATWILGIWTEKTHGNCWAIWPVSGPSVCALTQGCSPCCAVALFLRVIKTCFVKRF
jgi:hypothetical protein